MEGSERKEDAVTIDWQTVGAPGGKEGRVRVGYGARADSMTGGRSGGVVVAGEAKIDICGGHLKHFRY